MQSKILTTERDMDIKVQLLTYSFGNIFQMKLEKKRSSSMDKIVKKLKSAQKKAQEMRNFVLANQMSQVDGSSQRVVSSGRSPQRTSLSSCFTCHAF